MAIYLTTTTSFGIYSGKAKSEVQKLQQNFPGDNNKIMKCSPAAPSQTSYNLAVIANQKNIVYEDSHDLTGNIVMNAVSTDVKHQTQISSHQFSPPNVLHATVHAWARPPSFGLWIYCFLFTSLWSF